MNWATHENLMSDTLDGEFAEVFEFRPMKAATVNERETPDGSRTIRQVMAIFNEETALGPELGGRPKTGSFSHSGGVAATFTNPVLDVDERQFNGESILQGDRFVRASTSVVYRAADVQPNGQGRFNIELQRRKKEI